MIFLVLLSVLCYLSLLLTQFLVNLPIDLFQWVHLPGIVVWGGLLLILAWLIGD